MAKQKKNSSKNSSKTSTNKRQSRSNTKQTSAHENMKAEIANELGVNLGPDATARQNGSVGGEMTKRLVSKKSKKTSRKKK